MWMLLTCGIWGYVGTLDEQIQVAIVAMSNQLDAWYKRRHERNPQKQLTRVHMRKSRIGTHADPACKTKGAETYGLFLFLMDILSTSMGLVPDPGKADLLLRGGRALDEMLQIFRAADFRLTADEQTRAWNAYLRFLRLTQGIPDMDAPKRHMVLHMLERLPDLGNPSKYANWRDESLNKDLKKSCRGVSQLTFERGLYCRMRAWLKHIFMVGES